MQGFFSKKETESISAVGGKIHSCASCGLYKHCQSPKMKPYGKFQKGIICIGEAPGEMEDKKNKPWQGKTGRLLQRTLRKYGIDLFRDCLSLNAVNCRPEDNRTPTVDEINHCRSVIVWKALKEYQPKVIIAFGSSALTSIIGHRWQGSDSISTWRGFTIPDQDLKAWVCPTFHPSYLEHIDKPDHYMNIWEADIQQALKLTEVDLPRYKKPEIEMVSDLRFLNDFRQDSLATFDYETTGIKPHAKGQKIVSCAIADSENHAWAFVLPRSKKKLYPLRKWLHNCRISKIAHNAKFEDIWSKVFLKVTVNGWEWDSMLAAHLIDNRPGITSLDFQTYANFGMVDYSSEVKPYLKGVGDSDNAINRIDELLKTKSGTESLLTYNGLDVIYEYRLAVKQMEQLGWDFLPF